MKILGIECHQIENSVQKLQDGTDLKLPPVLFGTLGKDTSKKTLLIYGHLDVQPADILDGWNTEPFKMIEKDGKFFGRGTSDDKGPVIGWLNAIESMQKLNIEIPVNLKVFLKIIMIIYLNNLIKFFHITFGKRNFCTLTPLFA